MSKPNLPTNPFKPQEAQYFEELNDALKLTAEEMTSLEHNGFVVLDRLRFKQFKRAYAWIYWKDLPVLVTTDAILHSIHQTYDELLKAVEINILTQKLASLLENVRNYLRGAAIANTEVEYAAYYGSVMDERLNALYADLDAYLSLPILLLKSSYRGIFFDNPDFSPEDDQEKLAKWLGQISWANRNKGFSYFRTNTEGERESYNVDVGIQKINLFGLVREVDFTQFQARGHYDEPPALVAYFAAMMWLQLLDFRFVEMDSFGNPQLHKQQITAAYLLYDALEKSEQRQAWEEIDNLLSAFVGWSDNITINGLERFFDRANLYSAIDCLEANDEILLKLLTEEDFGHQKIRGQYQSREKALEGSLSHNISFALIGQRYTVESDILQQLVFDKLIVNGESVARAYPSPLDLMYVLGNERALNHLSEELAQYGYQSNLQDLRSWLNSHSEEFWQSSFYNYWLNAIRTLNQDTSSETYPTAMRSDAWADKTLNTQLGSWTQLRHDNILYVKPPYSPTAVCDYPAGYVEPYPDFYDALRKYAQFGREIFSQLSLLQPEESYEQVKERHAHNWWHHEHEYPLQKAVHIRDTALNYFDALETVMQQLQSLAEKELAGTAFNKDDNLFLRSMMVRKYVGDTGYGGRTEEHWNGWYNDLLPFGDDSKQLIADVHTNYNPNIGEVGVLHLGTEEPSAIVFLLDTAEKSCVYLGSSFTVREHREMSNPPKRLTDDEWHRFLYKQSAVRRQSTEQWLERSQIELSRLEGQEDADALQIARLRGYIKTTLEDLAEIGVLPQMKWTASFRVSSSKAELLELPAAYQDFAESLSPELAKLLDSIYEGFGNSRGLTLSGRRSLAELGHILLNEPEEIRSVKGMTEALFQELRQKLEEKGHLRQ